MSDNAKLMAGRRGLVLGVANDHSIAWGIARTLAAHGAEIAFTYQDDNLERRVRPLAESVGSDLVLQADVEDAASLDAVFAALDQRWGRLDFLVHSLAWSDRAQLQGAYVDTTAENFARSLHISCFSLTDLCRRALPLMEAGGGGSVITLTYAGSMRVAPNYNVMGVAKAALEASVRYLAADLGPRGIRVNALSPGPLRTLAGSAVRDSRELFKVYQRNAPLRRNPTLDEVGGAALYFLSDLSGAVTGEVHHIDGGYHIIGVPRTEGDVSG